MSNGWKFDPLSMVKRDVPYIIVIILCLLAIYITLDSVHGKVQEAYDNCDDYIEGYCNCEKEFEYNGIETMKVDVNGMESKGVNT